MALLRTWMFVPGNQQQKLDKVPDLPADVILYDLEDSVVLGEKDEARRMVRLAIEKQSEKCIFVRINDISTSFYSQDVEQMAREGVTGLVVPKAEKQEDIQRIDHLLDQSERTKGLPVGSIEIVPLIESASGVYHAYHIAKSSGRVKRLAFGGVDFTLDIHAQLTKEGLETLYARSQIVVASRAAGIEPPIDTVFIDLKDEEGLLRDAQLAKQLGFQGKLCIHPAQINRIHQVFSPTKEEIEEAAQILSAFEQAVSAGSAATQVNGKMVDYPVAHRARRIVDAARQLGLYPQ